MTLASLPNTDPGPMENKTHVGEESAHTFYLKPTWNGCS
jgi:hypothetical protein